jgi:cysteine desulfuration protein SufE
MSAIPAPLAALLEEFKAYDRGERAEMLIDYADRFRDVGPDVASRPFAEQHRVPHCESDAFVWATDREDGTLQFHFAVENPQGLSARAWCVILGETCSGQPLEQVAAIPSDTVFAVFGREVSMGKGLGLVGIVEMVTRFARERLTARAR